MFGFSVAVAMAAAAVANAAAEAEAMKRARDAHTDGTWYDLDIIDLTPGDVRVVEEPKLLENSTMYTAIPSKPAVRPSALGTYTHDALDDLLYDWYCREQGYQVVEGYARGDAVGKRSTSSDQWRSSDEVIDDRIEAYVMPAISEAMDELDGDHRLAILIEQRNRMGPAVWKNPRAKDGQAEAYQLAKAAISPILRRKGVVWDAELAL